MLTTLLIGVCAGGITGAMMDNIPVGMGLGAMVSLVFYCTRPTA
ncbi:hypothetical protein [Carnimonas nigrificans]|nr:hypothetical protein [Carnimonas nigrificans]